MLSVGHLAALKASSLVAKLVAMMAAMTAVSKDGMMVVKLVILTVEN